ncbi:MAG: hypothetical protein FJW66_04420 [Actinobacteria bacterium]|nr:hypothetical protein [Actinomycetota bacterium]
MFKLNITGYAAITIALVFLITGLLTIIACKDEGKGIGKTDAGEAETTTMAQPEDESKAVFTENDTAADTTAETTEYGDDNSSVNNTGTDGSVPESGGAVIKFKGNEVNYNPAVLLLELNTGTGDITGVLQMGFSSFELNANSTSVCDYVLNASITGVLDPETLKISGLLKGRAETDTETEGCKDYDVSYKMLASISEDYSKIRGYFRTGTYDDYDFFLKKK